MKIKLIIILFGISCLFFPGGLMEADALPIGPILKGVKELVEHTAQSGIVKIQGAKIGLMHMDAVELCSSIKSEHKKPTIQTICNEDDQVEFEKRNYEQYGFSIQTPTSWQPYDVTSSLVELNEDPDVAETVMLMFSDDSDVFNTEADGFFLIISYFADGTKLQKMQNLRADYEQNLVEFCDGTPDKFGTACSDGRIIDYEENGNTTMIKIISEEILFGSPATIAIGLFI